MNTDRRQRSLDLLSGKARGPGAALARGGLSIVEPLYAGLMSLRNAAYDRGWKRTHDLGRPTISVGNLTTGGTGKTPVVMWLLDKLLETGRRPAVLLRGYKSKDGRSDEAIEYAERFGARVIVEPDPDRVAAAARALFRDPSIDTFVLDDGFQHRRVRRDFDLVLIDATNPFGHDHVLPRGLLREPPAGLSRASAVLITRAELVSADSITRLVRTIDGLTGAPTWLAHNELGCDVGLDGLQVYAFCGIGNPAAFRMMLERAGVAIAGFESFADHHAYTPTEFATLRERAKGATLITTAKDLARLSFLKDSDKPRVARIVPRIDGRLWEMLRGIK